MIEVREPNLAPERLKPIADDLKRRCIYGVYHAAELGIRKQEDQRYVRRCQQIDDESDVLLQYTRDVDHELTHSLHPHCDGCLHLSISPAPHGVEFPPPIPQPVLLAWIVAFFGEDQLSEVWFEEPKTELGQQFQVRHARRLALGWKPIAGAIGARHAKHFGWVRAAEFFMPQSPAS